jgi:hypothetical protein
MVVLMVGACLLFVEIAGERQIRESEREGSQGTAGTITLLRRLHCLRIPSETADPGMDRNTTLCALVSSSQRSLGVIASVAKAASLVRMNRRRR